jgi:hypothetical protein
MKVCWCSAILAVVFVCTAFCEDDTILWKLTRQQETAFSRGANGISGLLQMATAKVNELKAALPTDSSLPKEQVLESIRSDYFNYLGQGGKVVEETRNTVNEDLKPAAKASAYVFFTDINQRFRRTTASVEKMKATDVLNIGNELVMDLKATNVLFVAASEGNAYYDLEVRSDPEGGDIDYRYDLDSTFQRVTGHTDRTIYHLIKSRTHVKVTVDKYGSKEAAYDPGTDDKPVLVIVFR